MTDLSLETTKQARLPAIRLPALPIGKLFRALANACAEYGNGRTDLYVTAMGGSRPTRREEERY